MLRLAILGRSRSLAQIRGTLPKLNANRSGTKSLALQENGAGKRSQLLITRSLGERRAYISETTTDEKQKAAKRRSFAGALDGKRERER